MLILENTAMQQYDHLGQPLFIHYVGRRVSFCANAANALKLMEFHGLSQNLLKQVSSGVYKGFSWGRTKQFPLLLSPKGQDESLDEALNQMHANFQDADSPSYEDRFDLERGFGDGSSLVARAGARHSR